MSIGHVRMLKDRINTGGLLAAGMLDLEEPHLAMESRGAPEFQDEWVRASQFLEDLELDDPIPHQVAQLLEEVRAAASSRVAEIAPQSDTLELAAAVSDDLYLVAKALYFGASDRWLNSLFRCYLKGVFPTGKLPPVAGSLAGLMNRTS